LALEKIASQNFGTQGTLLDIGANAGWVTIQTLAITSAKPRAVMVEPIPRHVDAIHFNTARLAKKFRIDIVPFALSDRNESGAIFTEGSNHGNSSLLESLVPSDSSIKTEIKLMDSADFVAKYLSNDELFVIKCDIQGYDAMVLSKFPIDVWHRTKAAVVEIWAIDEVNATDVQKCLEIWKMYRNMSWSPESNAHITDSEISNFWLGRSGESRNLFLSL
jgi:FkbM family methyltransferase